MTSADIGSTIISGISIVGFFVVIGIFFWKNL